MKTNSVDPNGRAEALGPWLAHMSEALARGGAVDVPCGRCNACCRSHPWVLLRPGEGAGLPKASLIPAPGHGPGHQWMLPDAKGHCPMLRDGHCSIYSRRPLTCRRYDCRVFSATGLPTGGPAQAGIQARVRRWRWSWSSPEERRQRKALRAAARFLRKNAPRPARGLRGPGRLAVLALQIYQLFLTPLGRPHRHGADASLSQPRPAAEVRSAPSKTRG